MLYISRWKTLFIWSVVALGVLVALPNAFTDEELEAFPSWFPTHKVTLGLDLQGGSHIMLKLERQDIFCVQSIKYLSSAPLESVTNPDAQALHLKTGGQTQHYERQARHHR